MIELSKQVEELNKMKEQNSLLIKEVTSSHVYGMIKAYSDVISS